MPEQIMIDDRERLADGPDDGKNADVRATLEGAMPHNMEKEWRLYDGRGYLDQRYEDKKLLLALKFDPHYVPCPWPVKRDELEGWTSGNTKRCGHTIPMELDGEKLSALERQGLAEIHCRVHLPYYFERYAPLDEAGNPTKRLPDTTKIYPPLWQADKDDDPHSTKREQTRVAIERKLAKIYDQEDEADQEMADEINRIQEEKEQARVERGKVIAEGAAVDSSELLKQDPPKRGRGRPKKE